MLYINAETDYVQDCNLMRPLQVATPYLLAYVVRVRCRSTLKMFITSRGRAYALFKRCIDRMHYDKGCQRLLKYSTMLGHIDHRLTFSKSITRNKGKEKLKH